MKFANGFWYTRPGLKVSHAAQVYEVEAEEDALVVHGTVGPVRQRSDTTGMPTVTVRYDSPLANVIRVEAYHHKGGVARGPEFELTLAEPPAVDVSIEADAATLTTGELSVRIAQSDRWTVDFLANEREGTRRLTSSPGDSLGFVDVEPWLHRPELAPNEFAALEGYPDARYMKEELTLGVGQCVYGLGERFTPFVKNGQVVDTWNLDGGTISEQTYKNIPFYMTNTGYGVFVAHPERVSFEIGSENVERVQFSVSGEHLMYYLIYGPTPADVLRNYTALTGRPALPPAWTFGLWLSTSFTTDYDEETVTSFVEGMTDREIPLHVFHFDCFWMKAFRWTDLMWDETLFPDPPGMLKRLKARGLHICVWINPYIAQRSPLFEEGMERGYLLKRPNGDVWQWDHWQAGMALVDFTNPDARKWYAAKLRALVRMGVDSFKTDFGERIPTDVAYYDGSSPRKMHNYYTYLYNRTVFEALREELGSGEAVVFARSATAGCQRFPVHWGGDSTATFESMAETLRGGLSLALSGFGFWSHDIGGFEHTADAAVYKRWCAFGLLSSHSRLHGARSYRVPWHFDEEAVEVLRFFTRFKCRLMPYLFGAAVEAHETGIPVLRPMFLEFPDDPGCRSLDLQYMLGGSLLVAPVFSTDGSVDFYLPRGQWTDILSGKVTDGGGWVRETHDFQSLPVLARPGSVVPMGCVDDRPDYEYADGVTFHVFRPHEGSQLTATVPRPNGTIDMQIEVSRRNNEILAEPSGATKRWSIVLHGDEEVAKVKGGRVERKDGEVRIASNEPEQVVRIETR